MKPTFEPQESSKSFKARIAAEREKERKAEAKAKKEGR